MPPQFRSCYSMPKSRAAGNPSRANRLDRNERITDYVARVEQFMREVISETERSTADRLTQHDLSLYGMVRYHLGWADETFQPAQFDAGKRIRPFICMHASAAVGGDTEA